MDGEIATAASAAGFSLVGRQGGRCRAGQLGRRYLCSCVRSCLLPTGQTRLRLLATAGACAQPPLALCSTVGAIRSLAYQAFLLLRKMRRSAEMAAARRLKELLEDTSSGGWGRQLAAACWAVLGCAGCSDGGILPQGGQRVLDRPLHMNFTVSGK